MKPLCWLFMLAALGLAGVGRGAPQVEVFSGPELLQPPAGLSLEGISVAARPPEVRFHRFAGLPDHGQGTLWSSWGDGWIADDGRYYTAFGNHLDPEGEAYVYQYDSRTGAVRRLVEARSLLPEPRERYAAGKIHNRIQQAADGWLYFATYWGKVPTAAQYEAGRTGGLLLRYDPRRGVTESLGPPVPGQSFPASLLDRERDRLFLLADRSGDLVHYDLAERRVVFHGAGERQQGNRDLFLDREGNIYFSAPDGALMRYRPDSRAVERTRARLPQLRGEAGRFLRASTRPARDGTVYGMTRDGALFAFDPAAETLRELGENWPGGQYVAVVELSPDERHLYYCPGAHGQAAGLGVPVVRYEIATGRREVVAFLGPELQRRYAYNCGGTYNLKVTPDGSRLYITFNGAPVPTEPVRRDPLFGEPSLVDLRLPPAAG